MVATTMASILSPGDGLAMIGHWPAKVETKLRATGGTEGFKRNDGMTRETEDGKGTETRDNSGNSSNSGKVAPLIALPPWEGWPTVPSPYGGTGARGEAEVEIALERDGAGETH